MLCVYYNCNIYQYLNRNIAPYLKVQVIILVIRLWKTNFLNMRQVHLLWY